MHLAKWLLVGTYLVVTVERPEAPASVAEIGVMSLSGPAYGLHACRDICDEAVFKVATVLL
jgi:hypothetical protein